MTTPTEKDAMALAVLGACAEKLLLHHRRNAEYVGGVEHSDLQKRIREASAHLASRIAQQAERIAQLEQNEQTLLRAYNRAEAELAAVRGLLIEIRGDCEFAYGVSEHNYRQFCDSGAMGRMPSDTWARHCQRRIEQIDAARGGE